jgi:hypothetical protein
VPTPSAQTAETRARLWSEANAARDQGRIERALRLYAGATALPVSPQASHDAGMFVLQAARNLEGVEDLYDRHYTNLGLTGEAGAGSITGRLVGGDNAEFALDRLTQANTFPGVPAQWQEDLADALVSRGQQRQALQWRRLLHRRDPSRFENELAVARLCEVLGQLDDAGRQYGDMLYRWPDDPNIVFGLTWVQEQLGRRIDTVRLDRVFTAASLGLPDADTDADADTAADDEEMFYASAVLDPAGEPPERVAGRVVRVVWAGVRRGPKGLTAGARSAIGKLVRALGRHLPRHPTTLLAQGYWAYLEGDEAAARPRLLSVSLALDGGASLGTGLPACDAALHDATHWARALVAGGGSRRFGGGTLPAVDTAALGWAHSREVWSTDGLLASLPMYSAALRAHHVQAVPLQYEIRGNYKVLHHDGLFYAIPKSVPEFRIINGQVFRLQGRARSSTRLLPPWVVDLGYRVRGTWRELKARRGLIGWTARRAGGVFQTIYAGWGRGVAAWAERMTWKKYGVKGVLVAPTPQELFHQIDSHRDER